MIERSMGATSTAFGSPLHGPNLTAAGLHPTQRDQSLTGIARPLQAGEPIFHHSPRCERPALNTQSTNPYTDVPPLRLIWGNMVQQITGVIALNIITSIIKTKSPLIQNPCMLMALAQDDDQGKSQEAVIQNEDSSHL